MTADTSPTKPPAPATGHPTPSTEPPAPAASTSSSVTARQIWLRARGVLLAVLLLVVAAIALAAARSGDQHGRLDPRSADRYGSRAVAELLRDRGISVRVVTTLRDATSATGPDTTLLVTAPDLLTAHQQDTLRAATAGTTGRTVLLHPESPSLGTLAPGVEAKPSVPVVARPPACALPEARRAGSVETGGIRYDANGLDADACYPTTGFPSVLLLRQPAAGETVLLGSPDFLYNERLAHQGNASLALQLLGSRPHLVWYLPSLTDPSAVGGAADDGDTSPDDSSDGGSSFLELIPSGWLWGTLQLAVAAGLAAIWRARRLGPLVTERLPVAIRASESTEGRARLNRKANARDRAAASLRHAARTRLAPRVGVSPHDAHSSAVLLPALSTRLGPASNNRQSLLFGPAPSDDRALVLLADQLDSLEREVRTS
ncbi:MULTISPECIES: DUF4350 domain-containing protein [unclassified Streptomyces]|uniref:DUF4350 domain-containing protein n=1 Tax=unclassified Streptomyces TaxID=2593676 RepID=UPI000DAC7601|nr:MULTISPECIES: DUF4350 domain-containing protein [unclassified Streptomyces]PZT72075.1 DUF4350 domain-containing protein [Streptomyces sp. AC1-42T]PZT81602.1 DUF4350 domain-containing protein [Streptomyces sp. AC1-42W]